MKTCGKCKVKKSKAEFSKDSRAKDGLQSNCKSCNKAYKLQNKDRQKRWKEQNREREKENNKRWTEYNREQRNQYINQYNKQRKQTDPLFKLTRILRTRISISLKNKGYTKRSKTEEIIGASYEVVKVHLEETYLKNYGIPYQGQPIHIDHIIPCSSASSEAELLALQHYLNLQYLTPEDNLKKSDSTYQPLGFSC